MANIEKVTLSAIARSEKDGQKGPYTSVGIKTEEFGDQWINGYGNNGNANWKKGDVVAVEITKVDKNGKTYWNFKTPNPAGVSALEERVDKIERLLLDHLHDITVHSDTKVEKELEAKDLPF